MIDLFKAEDRRRGGPLEAAQHRFNPGHQLARGKGLGDVVVGAHFETQHAVVFAGAGGEKDDGNGGEAGVIAQPAAHVHAIAAGNHDVEQEQRGRSALGIGNQIGGGVKQPRLKSCGFKMVLHKAGDIGFVFENEDALAQNSSSLAPRSVRVGVRKTAGIL